MTTPNIEELIAKLRTSMGDLDCPNTYEFAMHQAADALQSQAERIKELELLVKVKNKPICDYQELIAERDTLRVQLADAELHNKQVERGLDKATAQLAEIEKTEPVLVVEKEPDYWSGGHFHEGSKPHIKPTKVWCLPIGTQLFTHPMPAQGVAELVELREWQAKAFEAHPNIDLDIAALSKYKGAK